MNLATQTRLLDAYPSLMACDQPAVVMFALSGLSCLAIQSPCDGTLPLHRPLAIAPGIVREWTGYTHRAHAR